MDQVDEIMKQLRTRGGAQVTIVDDTAAEAWRKDARTAARRLGRPVQTVRFGDQVVASLRDWPANELEQQVTDSKLQNVMNKIWTEG